MQTQKYDPHKIEKKWQKIWEDSKIFVTKMDPNKKKYYVLEMYPYPSAHLHMGHLRNYSIGDAFARYKRMKGFNVLYPMGYDAFGLPAENAAIKHKADPKEWTEANIKAIMKQQKELGLSYDWTRVLWSYDPNYYKWNQWFFLKMYDMGLAYQEESYVNWCPSCKTVLANEQVINGKCWRCSSLVDQKFLKQWFLRIRKYADELLYSLDDLNWPENVKTMQRNWIGRSEGTEIEFEIVDTHEKIRIFTTRADTIYGVTFMVFAPEHPLVAKWVKGTKYEEPFKKFLDEIIHEDRFKRTAEDTEKKGMFIGKYAINPMTGEKVPVYIGNFVIYSYGAGAVMAVPAHDQRDFEFAKKFNIPIKVVIQPLDYKLNPEKMARAYLGDGILDNSEEFTGMDNRSAIPAIQKKLEKLGKGNATINYRLRDWGISRQRYWGTPIPIIYCNKCGVVPVPIEDLPVLLPQDVEFTGEGNPLETSQEYKNVKCPKCGGKARRETDTMDTFIDSSWYFFKFASREDGDLPYEKDVINYWCPVDTYIGGIEHAILHLLYARFFTKVGRDLGLHNIDEPFATLITQGMINKAHPFCENCNKFLVAAYDNEGNWIGEYNPDKKTCNTCGKPYILKSAKMSKSLGNTVDPESITTKYGADTARLFILHAANPEKGMEWTQAGVDAEYKIIQKIWDTLNKDNVKFRNQHHIIDEFINFSIHNTIKQVTEFMEALSFRNALNMLIELIDTIRSYAENPVDKNTYNNGINALIKMLYPFIPHMMEEIWQQKGNKDMLVFEKWPQFDEKYVKEEIKNQWNAFDNLVDDIRNIFKVLETSATKDQKITATFTQKKSSKKSSRKTTKKSSKKSLSKVKTTTSPPKMTKMKLIVADDWKIKVISNVKKLIEANTDRKNIMREIMKDQSLKPYGKLVSKLVAKILDNVGKYNTPFKTQNSEFEFWKQTSDLLSQKLNLEIEIELEKNSKEPKKSQALPGKPAIILS
ncbi:MAG: leucine--tRNA ligase [Promethearchaeota archaeon]